MKRFIIKYVNGKIRQQRGINMTFHYLLGLGVINWIIDTKEGTVMLGDKDEMVETNKISTYDCSDLVTPKDDKS